MPRNRSTRPLNTQEIRTRIPLPLMAQIEAEADRKGLKVTDIVRMALTVKFGGMATSTAEK